MAVGDLLRVSDDEVDGTSAEPGLFPCDGVEINLLFEWVD